MASASASNEDTSKRPAFVTKTTVFLDQQNISSNPESIVERVKFDSSSLPTSPTSEDGPSSLLTSSGGGGILKRKGSMGSRQAPKQDEASTSSAANARKRSILKYDSFEVADDSPVLGDDQLRPRRGVLKKDSSYDDTLKPIIKYPLVSETIVTVPKSGNESMSSTTSSEDLENLIDQSNRGFVNVNIDPLPKSMDESNSSASEEDIVRVPSPRKSSLGPRLPVIPPSSVKITSDGNLACKLEVLSGQAEAKLKQMAEAEAKETSTSSIDKK